ncbi:hypothetical protein EYF80_056875 [Liparis tanakae]|uniref:Uncharacterized protein n=1 Tax=Liparis tanakae TaxID=230148 RepID=A0A4Z2EXI1_9TELE|nr:hypothetical protein EYF80_056875 [Liparis tanakae]
MIRQQSQRRSDKGREGAGKRITGGERRRRRRNGNRRTAATPGRRRREGGRSERRFMKHRIDPGHTRLNEAVTGDNRCVSRATRCLFGMPNGSKEEHQSQRMGPGKEPKEGSDAATLQERAHR